MCNVENDYFDLSEQNQKLQEENERFKNDLLNYQE